MCLLGCCSDSTHVVGCMPAGRGCQRASPGITSDLTPGLRAHCRVTHLASLNTCVHGAGSLTAALVAVVVNLVCFRGFGTRWCRDSNVPLHCARRRGLSSRTFAEAAVIHSDEMALRPSTFIAAGSYGIGQSFRGPMSGVRRHAAHPHRLCVLLCGWPCRPSSCTRPRACRPLDELCHVARWTTLGRSEVLRRACAAHDAISHSVHVSLSRAQLLDGTDG